LNEVLKDPEVIGRVQSHGAQVEPGSPEAPSSKGERRTGAMAVVDTLTQSAEFEGVLLCDQLLAASYQR
jgi:hypothetical protein